MDLLNQTVALTFKECPEYHASIFKANETIKCIDPTKWTQLLDNFRRDCEDHPPHLIPSHTNDAHFNTSTDIQNQAAQTSELLSSADNAIHNNVYDEAPLQLPSDTIANAPDIITTSQLQKY